MCATNDDLPMDTKPLNVVPASAPELCLALVDNDDAASRALGRFVEQTGLHVQSFSNAESVLAAVEAGAEFLAVLADIEGDPALHFAARLRASGGERPPLFVHMVSSCAPDELAMDAAALDGAPPNDIRLRKPPRPDELRTVLMLLRHLAAARTETHTLQRQIDQAAVSRERTAAMVRHDLRGPISVGLQMIRQIESAENLSAADRCSADGLTSLLESAHKHVEATVAADRGGRPSGMGECRDSSVRRLLDEALALTGYTPSVVTWTPDRVDPVVCVDPVSFRRALQHLLANVRQHAGGSVHVEVRADLRSDQGHLLVDVRDRGPGLPAEPESAPSESAGLSYCAQALGAHGGRLELFSRDGGGLVARTLWPSLVRLDRLDEPLAPANVTGSTLRVWLVDDEPLFLRATGRLLRLWSHDVRFFERGGDVIAAASQGGPHPDLVLCDSEMPAMSGIEVLRRIRIIAPEITRVLYTAHPPGAMVVEAFNQGTVHRYIQKSEGPAALKSCLDAVTNDRRDHRGHSVAPAEIDLGCELNDLIERRQLKFHVQPIFSCEGRAVVACEALMRSTHDTFRGPIEILDTARANRCEVALQQVLSDLALQVRACLPDSVTLLVNLDPVLLHSEWHLEEGLRALYPVSRTIVLELTERVQLGNDQSWVTAVQSLRLQGFRIALDDVGAGFNSLGAVAALQPDVIKLDISLVSGVHSDGRKSEMVRLLCDYARQHSLTTVAEGIEEAAEAEACAALGVNWLQGYHLGRPMSLAQLARQHNVALRAPPPDWAHD